MKHKTLLLTLTFLLGSIVAFAQTAPANISGTYEGMVKRPGATAEEKVTLELKSEGTKVTGRATHGTMTADVTDGKFENGTLTLTLGNDVKFVAKLDGDKLIGEATHGTDKVQMELKKVTAAASPAPATRPSPDRSKACWTKGYHPICSRASLNRSMPTVTSA